jgi:hypothetical protein
MARIPPGRQLPSRRLKRKAPEKARDPEPPHRPPWLWPVIVGAVVSLVAGGLYLRGDLVFGDEADEAFGIAPAFVPLWPARAGCSDVMVAMPQGGPAIDAIPVPGNAEPRNVLATAGAAAWGQGSLDVLITSPGRPITVDIRFHVDGKQHLQKYGWVLGRRRQGRQAQQRRR